MKEREEKLERREWSFDCPFKQHVCNIIHHPLPSTPLPELSLCEKFQV